MEFLCLTDLIVNLDDVVMISPRWEIIPHHAAPMGRGGTKRPAGTAIYIRGKEGPVKSEVTYEEVLEQLKLVIAGKQ